MLVDTWVGIGATGGRLAYRRPNFKPSSHCISPPYSLSLNNLSHFVPCAVFPNARAPNTWLTEMISLHRSSPYWCSQVRCTTSWSTAEAGLGWTRGKLRWTLRCNLDASRASRCLEGPQMRSIYSR